jgi:lipoate-protein ligase A
MDARRCRWLPSAVADGPGNMAADEVMLEAAVGGVASLRFYSWATPTLSLGYFQTALGRLADPLLAHLPYVRRSTGGSALVHDREVTYALALPSGVDWQPRGRSWLTRMHALVARVLAEFDISVATVGPLEERKLGEFLCFLHQTPGDLTLGGCKVMGSAQRKQRGALLQHGSLLLARSPHAPVLPGLQELHAGVRFPLEQFEERVAGAFRDEAGCTLEPGDWTAAELQRRDIVAAAKYADAAWNEKR